MNANAKCSQATQEDDDMFTKHAALIWRQDGCTIAKARMKAWFEGPTGYADRLKQEELDKQNESL